MKGIFIPEITVEMFRDGCLESIEALMLEGEIYDIEYDPKSTEPETNCSEIPNNWIPCSERLPEDKDYDETFSVTIQCEHVDGWDDYVTGYADWTPHGWDIQSYYLSQIKVTAWMPLPEPYQEEGEQE